MAAGLFDTPRNISDPSATDTDDRYRALGGTTIAAVVLTLLSPLAFLDWWLAVVPVLGMMLGLVSWRDITARPDVLTGRPLAIAAIAISALALVGGLVHLTIAYNAELPAGFVRLGYAALQPLPGDPPNVAPDTATSLDGRNVLLKGYMYPGKQQRGIVQFLLVRDQGDCCFGGNPKITDRVLVTLADPRGIDFSPRLTKLAGRFAVRPTGMAALDGGVLYHIEDAVVR